MFNLKCSNLFLVTMDLKGSVLMKNVLLSRVKTWIMTLYLKIVLKEQTTAGPKGEKYNVIFLYNVSARLLGAVKTNIGLFQGIRLFSFKEGYP